MPKSYWPRPDILLVSQDAKKLRNSISGFLPNIALSMIDYGRSFENDKFYISCQSHRDYYKDFTGKSPRIKEFEIPKKMFASSPLPTDVYVNQPMYYMTELRPVTYPITIQRKGRPANDGQQIKLDGQYNCTTCIKYKR